MQEFIIKTDTALQCRHLAQLFSANNVETSLSNPCTTTWVLVHYLVAIRRG
jgi:hypothetical protein